ncbi:MAG: hypothetical protein MJ245_05750 [Clostridia bacterium]|nr:hypothetical protein [Clostridia bacterium]
MKKKLNIFLSFFYVFNYLLCFHILHLWIDFIKAYTLDPLGSVDPLKIAPWLTYEITIIVLILFNILYLGIILYGKVKPAYIFALMLITILILLIEIPRINATIIAMFIHPLIILTYFIYKYIINKHIKKHHIM